MEKDIKQSSIDIVIKAKDGGEIVFQIKDPKQLHKTLLNDIKQDFFLIQNNSIVIHPEQKIIDTQGVFIDSTSRVI
jgi:hypothetical protein